jgi:hypothetical protein
MLERSKSIKINDDFFSDSFENLTTEFFGSTEFTSALAFFDGNDIDFFSDDFAYNTDGFSGHKAYIR